jgi:tetratricopeptide (TPR) repeat protein
VGTGDESVDRGTGGPALGAEAPTGDVPGLDAGAPEVREERGYAGDRSRADRDQRGFRGDRERGFRDDRGFRGDRDRDRDRTSRGPGVARQRADEQGEGLDLTPVLPDDINARDLDRDIRDELRSLPSSDANMVARHLIATARFLDDEPEVALAHARAARSIAPRIAAVREALGLASYRNGEWQSTITELRTYHRLTGRQTHLAVIADAERALGRPERAIDIYRTADRSKLAPDEAVELLIVAAGARGDLGQRDAAVSMLQVRELTAPSRESWVARLRYAYADALLAAGRREEARAWFARAADIDEDLNTDAAERLLELDGVVLDDLDAVLEEDEADEARRGEEAAVDVDADEDLEDEDLEDEDFDEDAEVLDVEAEEESVAEADELDEDEADELDEDEADDEAGDRDGDRDSGAVAARDPDRGDQPGERGGDRQEDDSR